MQAFVFTDYESDFSLMIYADDEENAWRKLKTYCATHHKIFTKFDIFIVDKIIY